MQSSRWSDSAVRVEMQPLFFSSFFSLSFPCPPPKLNSSTTCVQLDSHRARPQAGQSSACKSEAPPCVHSQIWVFTITCAVFRQRLQRQESLLTSADDDGFNCIRTSARPFRVCKLMAFSARARIAKMQWLFWCCASCGI